MVYLVDANNLLHIVWFATKNPSFYNINKAFLTLLYSSCKLHKDDSVFEKIFQIRVIWDFPSGSWRNIIYNKYKSSRKEQKEFKDLYLFQDIRVDVKSYISKHTSLKQIAVKGFEADDIIAEIIRKAFLTKKGSFVILSNDKDYYQLLSEDKPFVAIQKLGKTKKGYKGLFNYKVFVDKYGIEPKLWPSVRSLMGDSSDNIPGVRGIGEKTAIAIVKRYGHLKNWINGFSPTEENRIDNLALLAVTKKKEVMFYYKLICLLKNYSDEAIDIRNNNTLK